MKFLRWGTKGKEKPGVLDSSFKLRDLSSVVDDITSETIPELLDQNINVEQLPLVSDPNPRIGACVGKVGKFICIGLNYADHAKETGMEIPPEPVIFFKAVTAITGPYDSVEIPRNSKKTDWEVELGVIIGKHSKYVDEDSALNHVAGYCVVNDVSERNFQMDRQGQWVKGKSHDTFAPLGPWWVTKDEVSNLYDLNIWLEVNGKRYQDGNTANLVYRVPFLVSYLSQFMTLLPGDIISTGTPKGVGLGQSPPIYLKERQTMRLGIDSLGEQKQTTIQA